MGNNFLVTTAIPDPALKLLSDAGQVTVLPWFSLAASSSPPVSEGRPG
jgi:hypothetical protein